MSTVHHTTYYPLRRCSKCRCDKPETEEFFHKQKECKNNLRPDCRECHNNKSKAYYRNTHADRRQYAKIYNAIHAESNRKRARQWEKDNPEKKRERSRKAYAANPELSRAKSRAQYWKNPEHSRAKGRQYHRLHPEYRQEYGRRYTQANPEKVRVTGHRHRARMRALPATFTEQDWQRALEYFHDRCAVCERPIGLWHTLAQDHWIPVTKNGGYTPDNIIPLCHGQNGCNNSKHNLDPIKWLRRKFSPRKVKQILMRINAYFEWVKNR